MKQEVLTLSWKTRIDYRGSRIKDQGSKIEDQGSSEKKIMKCQVRKIYRKDGSKKPNKQNINITGVNTMHTIHHMCDL